LKTLSTIGFALLGACLIAIGYGLARFTFGLFVPPMRAELDLGADTIGLIGSIPFISFVGATLLAPLAAGSPAIGLAIKHLGYGHAFALFSTIGLLVAAFSPLYPRHFDHEAERSEPSDNSRDSSENAPPNAAVDVPRTG